MSFALNFLALSGRSNAFISNVHKEKNHAGQIAFAKVIYQYIQIEERVINSLNIGEICQT